MMPAVLRKIACLIVAFLAIHSHSATNKQESRCNGLLLLIAEHFHSREANGEISDFTALTRELVEDNNGIPIVTNIGIIRFVGMDRDTSGNEILLYRKFHDPPFATPGHLTLTPGFEAARLGSQAAYKITEKRVAKRFARPDNFPAFFARVGGSKFYGPNSFDRTAKARIDRIWNALLVEHGFQPSNYFDVALRRYNPEQFISELFFELAQRYYKETGENLIRSGILTSLYTHPSNVGLAVQPRGRHNKSDRAVGGRLSDLPHDVYHYLIVESWKNAAILEGNPTPWHLELTKYSSSEANVLNTPSWRIDQFKKTGLFHFIEPIIKEHEVEIKQFLDPLIATGNVVFVPVPPTRTSQDLFPNRIFAQQLTEMVGGGVVAKVLKNRDSATPQTFQPYLWNRIENIGRSSPFEFTSGAPFRDTEQPMAGKIVVLIDDIRASAVTQAALTHMMTQAGADKVHSLMLAQSGDSLRASSAGPSDLANTVLEARTIPSETIETSQLSPAQIVENSFGQNGNHPWVLLFRTSQRTNFTVEENKARKAVAKAVKDHDAALLAQFSPPVLEEVLKSASIWPSEVQFWVLCFNKYAGYGPTERPSGPFVDMLLKKMHQLKEQGVPTGAYPDALSQEAAFLLGIDLNTLGRE